MISAFLEFLQAVKAEENFNTKLRQLHFTIGERFVQYIIIVIITVIYVHTYYLVLINVQYVYVCLYVMYVCMYVCTVEPVNQDT